ncbi:MAG: flagellar basal-body MS-ring/collar protein FliF [Proteobacteria bacterium]|nr:flagellar basal-body MS-ring/collar protein FliF [Pseudomonadota bacterium]
MENLRAIFNKFFANLSEQWVKASTLKKGLAVALLLGVLGGVASLLLLKEADPYEYVFVDLPAEDVQSITTFFKRSNVVDYIADSKGIKVPTKDVMSLRIKLAQEGLPAHGIVGWEKFDSQEFTRTDFEQRINKQRAIQGELSRTIMMIDGITNAKVHIVSPKQSLFLEDKMEATAAVYLKTRRGAELDKKAIRGIVTLVSRSVEGLKPNNVSLIDGEGKMLTEIESEDPSSKMTKEMMTYKRQIEKQYEENIRGIVGRVVGGDRVEVKVDAIVDFTQESQTISDVDPDRVVVLSRETQGFSLSGSGLNPTGIPGSKSNVPGEQEQTSTAQSSTQNKKDSETVNFEIAKKVSQKTMPVGRIQRLSAAVLVDGKQEYPSDGTRPSFDPRSEAEIKQIEELVRSAIGFDDKRSDIVTVRNMMFQLDPVQMESIREDKKETREYISTIAISAAIALALVLFFTFIVRPYFRWLSYDPTRKHEQQLIEDFRPDLELGTLQNVQIKEDVPFEKLSPQEQVQYLAKNEPKRTTEAIRLLLNPHQVAI